MTRMARMCAGPLRGPSVKVRSDSTTTRSAPGPLKAPGCWWGRCCAGSRGCEMSLTLARHVLHRNRFELCQVGQVCLHTLLRHLPSGGPDDAVEDESSQVLLRPVFVEVGHDDAEPAATFITLDAPGNRFP